MTDIKWKIIFIENWDNNFKNFDKIIRNYILKKIDQMENDLKPRRLHNSRYCIEEIGQYRIAYIIDEINKTKTIYFIGNHKQYERWYKQ